MNRTRKNIVKLLILISFIYALILWVIPFYRASISEKLVTDGLVFNSFNSIKTDAFEGLPIRSVRSGSGADKCGIKPGDILLEINGINIKSFEIYHKVLVGSNTDIPLEYTVLRDHQVFIVECQVSRYFHLIFFIFALLGLGFLINGFVVAYSKPDDVTSIVFYLLGFTAALGLLMYGGVNNYISTESFLVYNYQLCLIMFFPAFCHFFLLYPLKYNFRRRKLVIPLLYILIFVLEAILYLIPPGLSRALEIVMYVLTYLPLLFIVAGIYFFIKSYNKLKPNKSLKYILYGLIIGLIGFLYYFFIFSYFISDKSGSIWLRMPSLLVLAIPLSFGYSIYKFKILDTENIIKKGMVFFVISILIVSAYFIIYYIVDTLISINPGNYRQIILIIILVALILFFDAINKKVKSFVDRNFFRNRYNYRETLLNFSRALPKYQNANDIISSAIKEIKDSMQVTDICLWINPDANLNVINENTISGDKNADKIFREIFSNKSEPVLLDDNYIYSKGFPEDFIKIIKSRNIILTVPVIFKNELIAALNLSPKSSAAASSYSEKDIDLLSTLANQIALTIDNARLRIKEIEKLHIGEEIQIASNIQKGLFPKNFRIDRRLDIYGVNIPYQSVGGDFFDLIKIDDNKILLSISDISLKGIPAAMYMAKLQSLIHIAAKHFSFPSDILKNINAWTYKKIERNGFITMSIAIINPSDKTISLARGGNCPAIRFSDNNIHTINSKGIALGIAGNDIFSENIEDVIIKYEKNDIFLFYTNGLTKVKNSEGDELSMDLVNNLILKNRNLKSKDISDRLMEMINSFKGNAMQVDDLLYLIIKFNADV